MDSLSESRRKPKCPKCHAVVATLKKLQTHLNFNLCLTADHDPPYGHELVNPRQQGVEEVDEQELSVHAQDSFDPLPTEAEDLVFDGEGGGFSGNESEYDDHHIKISKKARPTLCIFCPPPYSLLQLEPFLT